jgi:RNA polymerase sigma-70 factor, ECF subfamily
LRVAVDSWREHVESPLTIHGPKALGGPAPESVLSRDLALIESAAAGDIDSFDALIRPRLDRLFRMAVAITRAESDARDAVQEACIAAWRDLPRLRDRSRFDSWLAQIVVNACRAALRKSRRSHVREIDVAIAGESDAASFPARRAHDEALAESQAIQLAFERLDPSARALLVLHYVEERPIAEIASIVGSPVGTVKWRLSNAREALARALKAERR